MIRLLLLLIAYLWSGLVLCGRFNLTRPQDIVERFGFMDWTEKRIEPDSIYRPQPGDSDHRPGSAGSTLRPDRNLAFEAVLA